MTVDATTLRHIVDVVGSLPIAALVVVFAVVRKVTALVIKVALLAVLGVVAISLLHAGVVHI